MIYRNLNDIYGLIQKSVKGVTVKSYIKRIVWL